MLAHIAEKLKRTYNVYDFMLEKQRALDLWSARLQEIVNAPTHRSDVIALQKAKRS